MIGKIDLHWNFLIGIFALERHAFEGDTFKIFRVITDMVRSECVQLSVFDALLTYVYMFTTINVATNGVLVCAIVSIYFMRLK